jgi:hypothetical protein
MLYCSIDSVSVNQRAGIATDLRARRRKNRGLVPGRGRKFFSFPLCPDRLRDPPKLLSNGYRELFPKGVKRTGREALH